MCTNCENFHLYTVHVCTYWLVQYMTNLVSDPTVVVVLSCSLWRVTDNRAKGKAILVDQPDLLLLKTFSLQDHFILRLRLWVYISERVSA